MVRLFKSTSIPHRKVFLGGTCNGSDWRSVIIPHLQVPYFNPVVSGREWTEEDKENEIQERSLLCSHMLYVITPETKGLFAIAELIHDSITKPNKTVVCFLRQYGDKSFDDQQWSSIESIIEMIRKYHNSVCTDLDSLVDMVKAI
jgi:hypothetical protein